MFANSLFLRINMQKTENKERKIARTTGGLFIPSPFSFRMGFISFRPTVLSTERIRYHISDLLAVRWQYCILNAHGIASLDHTTT